MLWQGASDAKGKPAEAGREGLGAVWSRLSKALGLSEGSFDSS